MTISGKGTKTPKTSSAAPSDIPLPANVEEKSVPEVADTMDGTEEEEAKAAPKKKVEVVRLKDAQHFEQRIISAADWKKAGVENGSTRVWDKSNSFQVPVEDFGFLDELQFRNYILADARFEIVTV